MERQAATGGVMGDPVCPDQPVADTYRFSLTSDAWICFHCGERFSVAEQGCYANALKAAQEHFGEPPDDDPLCKLSMWENRELAKRLREAEQTTRQAIEDRETAEDEAQAAQQELASISSRFKGASTVYDAFCMFDSMEGRALAAEAILADLEQVMPRAVALARERVCRLKEPAA